MLRATSDTAAAITVRSPEENPSEEATRRHSWRAVTMSTSAWIGIRCSAPTPRAPLGTLVEIGQAFLEIERGGHSAQREAQLHHGERDLGLDPHDHRLSAAQHDHLGQGAAGPHAE